jgi:hypothetical protein
VELQHGQQLHRCRCRAARRRSGRLTRTPNGRADRRKRATTRSARRCPTRSPAQGRSSLRCSP